jgi:CRP-like cAMP-binding protein
MALDAQEPPAEPAEEPILLTVKAGATSSPPSRKERVWEIAGLDEPLTQPPDAQRFDELEFDVEAAAQGLWAGPGSNAAEAVTGDSLLHAVERAAEAAEQQLGAEPEVDEPYQGSLPQVPLFSDLDPEAFVALFQRCPLKRVAAGERILTQGERGDAFYVVCAGRVRVLRQEGEQSRPLAELGEGAFFGEMALLSGSPRAASVDGVAEETQLLEISASLLAELAGRYPGVARALKRFCRQRMLANVMETAPLFTAFDRRDRKQIAERFRARDAIPEEVLVREGQESDGLYVVLSGEVEVRQAGTRRASLREGELFGERSLLTKSPSDVTVVAKRRTSLLRLPRQDFDGLILSHPQVLVFVAELMEQRSQQ